MNFPSIKDIYSGTYTPILTNDTNITASNVATYGEWTYTKIGDVVTVSGAVAITPTVASSLSTLYATLPIPSNLTLTGDLGGTGSDRRGNGWRILAGTGIDGAVITGTPSLDTLELVSITFQYRIK